MIAVNERKIPRHRCNHLFPQLISRRLPHRQHQPPWANPHQGRQPNHKHGHHRYQAGGALALGQWGRHIQLSWSPLPCPSMQAFLAATDIAPQGFKPLPDAPMRAGEHVTQGPRGKAWHPLRCCPTCAHHDISTQYSEASIIVNTLVVTFGSDGSDEPNFIALS